MRKSIKDLASIAAKTLPIEGPIYEFGSYQVKGQEGFADLRILFPGTTYVGADMRPGLGVDQILDLHNLDLPAQSVGTALCLETLEHVEYPHRAMEEIYRVLKPDGIALISSTMYFPIHDHPYDYWRFTPEAFRSLLKPFAHSFVGYVGKVDFPHTVIGVGYKGQVSGLDEFTAGYLQWKKQRERQDAWEFKHVARLLFPPFIFMPISRIYTTIKKQIRPDA